MYIYIYIYQRILIQRTKDPRNARKNNSIAGKSPESNVANHTINSRPMLDLCGFPIQSLSNHWPSQEPIDWRYLPYKAYFSGLNFRKYLHNSYGQTYGTFTYTSMYWILKISHCQWEFQNPKMEVLYHIRPYFVVIFPYIGLI